MRLTNRLHPRLLISRQRVQCLIAWKKLLFISLGIMLRLKNNIRHL